MLEAFLSGLSEVSDGPTGVQLFVLSFQQIPVQRQKAQFGFFVGIGTLSQIGP